MLPNFLKHSYKQYKDDTDRFATWLVVVAEKCGLERPANELVKENAEGKSKRKRSGISNDSSSTTGGEVIKAAAVEDDAGDEESHDNLLLQPFFMCLFHDLQNWRYFISQTWKEYTDLKIDLMSVSVVTDTALQFARDLIQDTLAGMSAALPADNFALQKIVCDATCTNSGIRHLSLSLELGLPFNKDMSEVAVWCFLWTGFLLESYLPLLQDDSLLVYKPGYLGTYDPKAVRDKMSRPDKSPKRAGR